MYKAVNLWSSRPACSVRCYIVSARFSGRTYGEVVRVGAERHDVPVSVGRGASRARLQQAKQYTDHILPTNSLPHQSPEYSILPTDCEPLIPKVAYMDAPFFCQRLIANQRFQQPPDNDICNSDFNSLLRAPFIYYKEIRIQFFL